MFSQDEITKISNMNDTQGEEYRKTMGKSKKTSLTSDTPNGYLKSKETYVDFIKKTNAQMIKKGLTPKITPNDILEMNEKEGEEYRKTMGVKKNAKFSSEIPPKGYLSNKTQYINFLKKNI